MATMKTAESVPAPPKPREWIPDEGMEFSTVEVSRTAFVAIEHPIGWTPAQISTAATKCREHIASCASWYDGDTVLVEVVRGQYEPDGKEYTPEPYTLTDEMLTDAPPVPVVEAPPETD